MIDLQAWCSPTSTRKFLQEPFNIDGKTVATNGYIMIILPEQRPEFDDLSEPDFIKGLQTSIRNVLDTSGEFHKLDAIPGPHFIDCRTCNGEDKATEATCRECDGIGEVEIENRFSEYTVDCKTCDGSGSVEPPAFCEDCGGTKKVMPRGDLTVDVAGVSIQVKHFLLLKSLSDDLEVQGDTNRKMVNFRSHECSGAIMSYIV